MKVKPPATYQGGKQRLAEQIIDLVKPTDAFADLCCGSGAMAIAARCAGVPMVDCGPWGIVWEEVAQGRFDLVALWVSEARAIGPEAVMLSAGRAQGGIKGKRAKPHEEWLSCMSRSGIRGLSART